MRCRSDHSGRHETVTRPTTVAGPVVRFYIERLSDVVSCGPCLSGLEALVAGASISDELVRDVAVGYVEVHGGFRGDA